MARQKKDRPVKVRVASPSEPRYYCAIDPGDVHVGYAQFSWHPFLGYEFSMGVLHRPSYSLSALADTLFDRTRGTVLVEDYRMRPVGHQRFSSGQTLRLLGALEYVAQRQYRPFHLSAAGNPDTDLPLLKFDRVLDLWHKRFTASRHGEGTTWRHAEAAWRILGMFVSRYDFPAWEPIVQSALKNRAILLQPVVNTDGDLALLQMREGDFVITPTFWKP